MLLYPKSLDLIINALCWRCARPIEVEPASPLMLFVWGVKRVLPVRSPR